MFIKKLLLFSVLAIAITLMTPYIFYSYFETKPVNLNQNLLFGGPFPFAEQNISLPEAKDHYPLEVKFTSPFEKETNFKATPFILSFICFFLFIFAFYSITTRFVTGRQVKGPH